jgi:hypothetical protein
MRVGQSAVIAAVGAHGPPQSKCQVYVDTAGAVAQWRDGGNRSPDRFANSSLDRGTKEAAILLIHAHRSHDSGASYCLVGSDAAGSGRCCRELSIGGTRRHVHDGRHGLLPSHGEPVRRLRHHGNLRAEVLQFHRNIVSHYRIPFDLCEDDGGIYGPSILFADGQSAIPTSSDLTSP